MVLRQLLLIKEKQGMQNTNQSDYFRYELISWTVLNWLKEDKELQHIPVHVMSGMNREKLKEMGAFDF
jgi:hypothetical protein